MRDAHALQKNDDYFKKQLHKFIQLLVSALSLNQVKMMKTKILSCVTVCSTVLLTGVASAGTFTVTTTASDGAGSFSQAIRDADASADTADTIVFNIPGAGPHYINPPANGFPLIIKDNLTIDGYSQPGSAVNTAPITATNNAVIKIILDARAPNNHFRDMAYCNFGTLTTSDPAINNSAMASERGGYGEESTEPYVPGEVAILGVYRAQNVTIKGLAFLGQETGSEYGVSVAMDYGMDNSVKNWWEYDQGSSRGFHLSGCWVGVNPETHEFARSGAAITAFRHRDVSGGPRPELPNMENMTIGVKAGSANPRAEFNVLSAFEYTIAAEGIRCRVAGNQYLGTPDAPCVSEIGRYNDTQVPSIVIGTDGDGVNDADEGNLFVVGGPVFYGTSDKVIVIAGNTYGLERDGSRPNLGTTWAVDEMNLSARSKLRFGSDFNGVSDALEANTVYDSIGLNANWSAPNDNAWVLLRGNSFVNCFPMIDDSMAYTTLTKFIDETSPYPFKPAITAATTSSLSGTCGVPLPSIAQVVIDVYESDPEGDLAGRPQGKKFLGSFVDNSPADSDATVGAFTFNISSLGVQSGTALTITASYLKDAKLPTVTSITRSGSTTTINFTDVSAPHSIVRSTTANGSYTEIAQAAASPAVFVDNAATSFYRVGAPSSVGGGQTTAFADSFTISGAMNQ